LPPFYENEYGSYPNLDKYEVANIRSDDYSWYGLGSTYSAMSFVEAAEDQLNDLAV
jgi:hypothetical protein